MSKVIEIRDDETALVEVTIDHEMFDVEIGFITYKDTGAYMGWRSEVVDGSMKAECGTEIKEYDVVGAYEGGLDALERDIYAAYYEYIQP